MIGIKMKTLFIISLLLISLSVFAQERSEKESQRTFMFIGEPNAQAWKYLMDNPQDRKEEVSAAMEKIGGKIIKYYFGLGDGKNYIIAKLPNDNELIQAVYLMRLQSGLLASYKIIELMPSNQMSNALKKSKELIEVEKKVSGGVDK